MGLFSELHLRPRKCEQSTEDSVYVEEAKNDKG